MPFRAGNCTITPPFVSLLAAMFFLVSLLFEKVATYRHQELALVAIFSIHVHAHINHATVSLFAAV